MDMISISLAIIGAAIFILKDQEYKNIWGIKLIFWAAIFLLIDVFTKDTKLIKNLNNIIMFQSISTIILMLILIYGIEKKKD